MNREKSIYGISDEEFIRGKVPMTKSEVRAITLSKLRLCEDSKVLDIGCGTGSITVECGLLCNKGMITSIDQKLEAIDLTKQNINKFGLTNTTVIYGKAPEDIPRKLYDRIFLGGGSKCIKQIIDFALEHLEEDGIFVANTILLDSTYNILKELEKGFSDIQCTMASIANGHKISGWMMKANNPIYIISARKCTIK
ncbi:MAG: precorrin-6Y C5,15-methyltransferase (decarboxylating) subunit CbiT [Vallitalea sp.]|jgi:cobalt-precorrin-6B (C15)-methyltransferase|nr:precorrin-6Y C5,15-methyltransferase (decarboxylating) subunit CbiT [Vallitalea sp.]